MLCHSGRDGNGGAIRGSASIHAFTAERHCHPAGIAHVADNIAVDGAIAKNCAVVDEGAVRWYGQRLAAFDGKGIALGNFRILFNRFTAIYRSSLCVPVKDDGVAKF